MVYLHIYILHKMKRNFDSTAMFPCKRQRHCTVLGKRNHDTPNPNNSKRARLAPGVLGKHHIECTNVPTAKKIRTEESESLRNFLVSAHTTIEMQRQHIFELEQRLKELTYLNLMFNNQMKNPTYKHFVECY